MTVRKGAPPAAGMLRRLASWSRLQWLALAAGGGVAGAAVSVGLARAVAPGPLAFVGSLSAGVLGLSVAGGGVCALAMLARLVDSVERGNRRVQAFMNVRPLTGELPLDLGGWAADAVFADVIVRSLARTGPELVVECGSGWSTVVIARCLEAMGSGEIVSLEHREDWSDATEALLSRYGVDDRVTVARAPLERRRIGGRQRIWYGARAEEAIGGPIDILVVDGPPGAVAPRSRYPAVPVFLERLASTATVILDDARREDERQIADEWSRELGTRPRLVQGGQGVWVFELGSDGGGGTGQPSPGPSE